MFSAPWRQCKNNRVVPPRSEGHPLCHSLIPIDLLPSLNLESTSQKPAAPAGFTGWRAVLQGQSAW